MKKILVLFTCMVVFAPLALAKKAASPALPDNIYFRAMKDEMDRTLRKLRAKDSPAPYYAAYRLVHSLNFSRKASFGQLYSFKEVPYEQLSAIALLGVGSDKNDQLGFENNLYYYEPSRMSRLAASYNGIRHALWRLTDTEYNVSLDSYVKKQAYKRKKELPNTLPDVTPAVQAAVFEPVEAFPAPDAAKWNELIKQLSAKGKAVPQLENFTASIDVNHWDSYYLNSLGGAYQIPFTQAQVELTAKLRNKDGHEQTFVKNIPLADYLSPDEQKLSEQTDAFLQELAARYNASKAQAYLGPVLLRPAAAAMFIESSFVWNVENVKPLLSDSYEQDNSAGNFREKENMRVLSNIIDISDRPLQREYKGLPLVYVPVDDEGVPAQELHLTSLGRLRTFPLSRRPLGANHQSNGHARLTPYSYPREKLTNVFVEAKTPLSNEALNEEFLAMCRDWELEYCYEVDTFNGFPSTSNSAWRVYTKDGHREPAYGLDLALIPRSLRDIAAAGSDDALYYTGEDGNQGTIITPSLLLEEVEILPVDAQPDRPPFVPKP